jgi:membrane fusion protein, multidrug efflux system
MRSLTISDRTKDEFVVSEGLQEGERVVVEGVNKGRPGIVVNPHLAGPDKPESRNK